MLGAREQNRWGREHCYVVWPGLGAAGACGRVCVCVRDVGPLGVGMGRSGGVGTPPKGKGGIERAGGTGGYMMDWHKVIMDAPG